MSIKKLLAVLHKQEKNLKELLQVAEQKKDILIAGHHDALFDIITHEEQYLLKIQLAEEDRLIIMKALFEEYNIDEERLTLSNLINGFKNEVNDGVVSLLQNVERRMKNYITEISNLNKLNMMLIQQSSTLINETIRAVIASSKKSIILDRKG